MNKTAVFNFFRNVFKFIFLEKVLFTLTNGKTLDSPLARIPANYYQYPPLSIRKVIRNGIHYKLDISDYMEWCIYFGIQTEPRTILFKYINKGDIVFDIGANIGEVSLNAAKLVGDSGSVHSFEPASECCCKLQKNVSLNSFETIVINNIGLGDLKGDFFISTEFKNNRGGFRIQPSGNNNPNIKVDTLDNYVSSISPEKINLIKIDVEGFEYNVLKGGEKAIEKYRPLLFIEINDTNLRQQNSSALEVIRFLNRYYKNISNAESNEIITEISSFKNCHFDIICKN